MAFEQIPTSPKKKSWEEEFEEKAKIIEDLDIEEEKLKEIDEKRRELDERYEATNDQKEKQKIEKEHKRLSKQAKEIDKKISGLWAEEPEEEKQVKERKTSTTKVMDVKDGERKEKKEEIEKKNLEKEITKRYCDELEKIKKMPCETEKQQNLKAKKCFELIEEWKDYGYLDNFEGVQKVFAEIEKSETQPTMTYYWQKKESIKRTALAMASNYDQWDIPNDKKIKIINSFVKNKSKENNVFYQKDKTLSEVAQILASKDIPYKDGIELLVKNIDNPTEKQKTIEKLLKIEKEALGEKKKYLKEIKETLKKREIPSEEEVKEQLKKVGASPEMEKIFQDPEVLSKILSEGAEILKDPEVQEKIQELKNAIEKVTKKKEEVPESVDKAKKHIEKKESVWGTVLGTAGWSILLFLVLFMLAEIKGIDYLSKQATGKKEKK